MEIGKYNGFSIVKMTNKEEGFYSMMGPFFGSRKVAKELGMPLWDDDRIWIIILDEGKVIGFCSFVIHKSRKKATLKSGYVLDEYRGQGIYNALFKARMNILIDLGVEKLISTTTEKSRKTHERFGFTHTINKGKYRVYEKDLRI
jgi:GNAT superfamily N-acetyltransferase